MSLSRRGLLTPKSDEEDTHEENEESSELQYNPSPNKASWANIRKQTPDPGIIEQNFASVMEVADSAE